MFQKVAINYNIFFFNSDGNFLPSKCEGSSASSLFFYASSYRPTLASVSNLPRTSHRCLVCNNLLCFQDMKARENIYSRKKMSSYEHGDPRLAVNCSSTSDTLPGLAKLWLRRMWAYYLQAEHSLQASTNFSQDFRSPSVHTLRFPFI